MEGKERGLLLVISAPSGGGKGTVLKELFAQDENLRLSVSATTRAPRPGEVHGEQYYFTTKEDFEKMIGAGEMLEYAQYVGNYYGTPKAPVEAWLTEGRDVVLEIEVQGGAQIKKLCPDCVSIFILPPSMEVLEKRLRGRGTEADKVVQSRLEAAKREIPCAREYDYIVYNDRLEDAVADVQAILRAEKRRYARNSDCIERVYPNA